MDSLFDFTNSWYMALLVAIVLLLLYFMFYDSKKSSTSGNMQLSENSPMLMSSTSEMVPIS